MEPANVLSKCSPSTCSSKQLLSTVPRCGCSSSSSLLSNPLAPSRGYLTIGKAQNLRLKGGPRLIRMRWGGGGSDNDAGGEEKPETLFMRELAKRKKLGQDLGTKETETKTKDEEKEESTKSKPTDDQRKRSLALNSEGLEGLVPRGQELVKLGGSFWLSLWPLIVASVVAFGAAYLYFGPAFVHAGYRSSPPAYVDPYQLLDSERLPSQVGPNRVPYNSGYSQSPY